MTKLVSGNAKAAPSNQPASTPGSNGGSSNSGGSSGYSSGASADRLIEIALSKLGCRYRTGAKGPSTFDCSGFVYWCLNQAGVRQGYMTSKTWRSVSKYKKISSIDSVQKRRYTGVPHVVKQGPCRHSHKRLRNGGCVKRQKAAWCAAPIRPITGAGTSIARTGYSKIYQNEVFCVYKVDLNSDLGESFGAYRIGCDEEVLDFVTSANVACGFHAGDPAVMNSTVLTARQKRRHDRRAPGLC